VTADRLRPSPIGEQLARCDGFVVRERDGRTIGRIAWLRYASRADCPDVLVIQRRGRLGGRAGITEIPADRVVQVDRAARTITLAE
jgi:hypothetical protein